MKNLSIAVIIAGLIFAVGCERAPQATAKGSEVVLTSTAWELTGFGGASIAIDNAKRRPRIEFIAEESRVQGFGGCNQFGGSYERQRQKLDIGSIVSTKMACTTGMDIEQQLFQALSNTNHFAIVGGELVLSSASNETLARFQAVRAPGA